MVTNLQDFFTQHLWKIALALGLAAVAVVLLGQGNAAPPVALEPTAVSTATPRPTLERRIEPTPQAVALVPTPSPTSPPPTVTPTPVSVYYKVQPGDVPLSIAAGFDISADELLAANNIDDPTLLQIGQELYIPVTATPSPTAPTPTPSPTLTPTATPEPVYHEIKAGDTLLEIAAEFDTSVEMIMAANDISDPTRLSIGQKVLIPSGEVDLNTPAVVHVIKAGDTFSYLSFFYGSTVDDILAANPGLEPSRLQIGQKVVIPVTSPPINPNANPGLPQITVPESPPETLADLQRQLLAAINEQRVAYGLPPYQADADLETLALAHGQDMIARGYFSHTTPEGVTLNDRFAQHNIDVHWTGENIQRNVKPIDRTVAEAMRWWMSSSVHRGNILHARFNHIGVGVAEGPTEWYTFVLVFAER